MPATERNTEKISVIIWKLDTSISIHLIESIAKSIAICLRFPQRAVSQQHKDGSKRNMALLMPYHTVCICVCVCLILLPSIYSNLVIISFSFIRVSCTSGKVRTKIEQFSIAFSDCLLLIIRFVIASVVVVVFVVFVVVIVDFTLYIVTPLPNHFTTEPVVTYVLLFHIFLLLFFPFIPLIEMRRKPSTFHIILSYSILRTSTSLSHSLL